MLEMNEMLKIIVERDGSDLHFSVGKQPVMRISGILDMIDPEVLAPEDTDRLMREITPPRYQQILQEKGSADFAYSYSEQARFRVALMRARGNISLVMRLIPSRIFSFDQLGLPEASVSHILRAHRGMVIIGQATENLPQILLDLDGDDIIAVGTLGILYGFRDNLADAPLVEGL